MIEDYIMVIESGDPFGIELVKVKNVLFNTSPYTNICQTTLKINIEAPCKREYATLNFLHITYLFGNVVCMIQ